MAKVPFVVVLTEPAAKRLRTDEFFKDVLYKKDRLLCRSIDWGRLLGLRVLCIGIPGKRGTPEAIVHIAYDAVLFVLEGRSESDFGIVRPGDCSRPGRRSR